MFSRTKKKKYATIPSEKANQDVPEGIMMKCPVCNDVRMREVEKDGVLIDVCPECKGVWLDRGELEKLMSEIREARPAFNEWYDRRDEDVRYTQQQDPSYRPREQDRNSNEDPRYRQQGHGYHKKKKKSVLDVFGDLFD